MSCYPYLPSLGIEYGQTGGSDQAQQARAAGVPRSVAPPLAQEEPAPIDLGELHREREERQLLKRQAAEEAATAAAAAAAVAEQESDRLRSQAGGPEPPDSSPEFTFPKPFSHRPERRGQAGGPDPLHEGVSGSAAAEQTARSEDQQGIINADINDQLVFRTSRRSVAERYAERYADRPPVPIKGANRIDLCRQLISDVMAEHTFMGLGGRVGESGMEISHVGIYRIYRKSMQIANRIRALWLLQQPGPNYTTSVKILKDSVIPQEHALGTYLMRAPIDNEDILKEIYEIMKIHNPAALTPIRMSELFMTSETMIKSCLGRDIIYLEKAYPYLSTQDIHQMLIKNRGDRWVCAMELDIGHLSTESMFIEAPTCMPSHPCERTLNGPVKMIIGEKRLKMALDLVPNLIANLHALQEESVLPVLHNAGGDTLGGPAGVLVRCIEVLTGVMEVLTTPLSPLTQPYQLLPLVQDSVVPRWAQPARFPLPEQDEINDDFTTVDDSYLNWSENPEKKLQIVYFITRRFAPELLTYKVMRYLFDFCSNDIQDGRIVGSSAEKYYLPFRIFDSRALQLWTDLVKDIPDTRKYGELLRREMGGGPILLVPGQSQERAEFFFQPIPYDDMDGGPVHDINKDYPYLTREDTIDVLMRHQGDEGMAREYLDARHRINFMIGFRKQSESGLGLFKVMDGGGLVEVDSLDEVLTNWWRLGVQRGDGAAAEPPAAEAAAEAAAAEAAAEAAAAEAAAALKAEQEAASLALVRQLQQEDVDRLEAPAEGGGNKKIKKYKKRKTKKRKSKTKKRKSKRKSKKGKKSNKRKTKRRR